METFKKTIIKKITVCVFLWFCAVISLPAFALTVSAEFDKPLDGRLFIIFSQDEQYDPIDYSYWPTEYVEHLFAKDLHQWQGDAITLDSSFTGFPLTDFAKLKQGGWRVQALFDQSTEATRLQRVGNPYSDIHTLPADTQGLAALEIPLSNTVEEQAVTQTAYLKYVKVKSQTLSAFLQRPEFIEATILLPASYYKNTQQQYPVYFSFGGFGESHLRAQQLADEQAFKDYWFDKNTPQFILVYPNGVGPWGDSYFTNSANNGPHADAMWQEFLPALEAKYRVVKQPKARFLGGCSTGGWVSLASQIFYPELFNGAYSYSADSPSFGHFQRINLYKDRSVFFNKEGKYHPAYTNKEGDTRFTIKAEVSMENALGKANSYAHSGGQWGSWNAVFSPKGVNGKPLPAWDENGKINEQTVAHWRQYDLAAYVTKHWGILQQALQGKLNITMDQKDGYDLHLGMAAFDKTLQNLGGSDAKFNWQQGAGHCELNEIDTLKEVLPKAYKRYVGSDKPAP